MAHIFSMPRPGSGYEPGQIVTEEFAATHPGMVSPAPKPEPESKQKTDKEAESDE
jgi:hypothetical protein